MKKIRCAIYTRKSSEEGLEQEFNSLDAQYEACAAYIASQKAEGWVLLSESYDDGGLSGGSMERPGLQRLLADIDRGIVDQILVYKIDRLTRSLADFAKMVERLDAAGTSFVSVTQSFNTATSMGRLTLNMLLSFAQFEREVTAERIRDKIAASKKKGLWMGATVPLGYAADGRSLKIAEPDAGVIRTIYDLYLEHRNTRVVKEAVDALGLKTPVRTLLSGRVKGGAQFSYGHIHYILTNPVYAGRIRHHAKVYPGQHPPLIDPEVWDSIQDQLQSDAAKDRTFTKRNRKGAKASASPLAGRIFDQTGDRLTPSHSKTAKGRKLRYYVSHRLVRGTAPRDPSGWRLPAAELEDKVADLVRLHLKEPQVRAGILCEATADETFGIGARLSELFEGDAAAVKDALHHCLKLVDRIDIAPGNICITLSGAHLAHQLDADAARIVEELLSITSAFQHRKRGVETRLIIGDAQPEIDATLLRNIARAHRYFDLVRSGKTFAEIAEAEGVSKRRVQQLIELAFLAPDIVRAVREGRQPVGMTSDRLKRHAFSPIWKEQRDAFATL
ncbi:MULTISPECIES: recombinase family protein [unclassified Ruegeria]|uniref:recombinase family protein n=1 Tax=unclassified Ruegeria TaxID=2625375 RepID=UPI001491B26E|nr:MULTISPECIES: recombinase family protein [unclassified Ruegeria]NOD36659.1 recombinase family protein [Ruegeria sp. HKCCD7296]NOE43842.1 recombinase family protein [Ruegeria sp. HKCCD7319]